VFREIDKDMSVGETIAFLQIAVGETQDGGGMSVTELSKTLEMPLATASRHVLALGQMDRHHAPGKELISAQVDLMERRKKILRLTPRGRRVLSSVTTALGGH
jgi:DNA-binding MarR family transcriptional regulator